MISILNQVFVARMDYEANVYHGLYSGCNYFPFQSEPSFGDEVIQNISQVWLGITQALSAVGHRVSLFFIVFMIDFGKLKREQVNSQQARASKEGQNGRNTN